MQNNNFHFKERPRNQNLLSQIAKIDTELQEKRNNLQRLGRIEQRRKLQNQVILKEIQFYEDQAGGRNKGTKPVIERSQVEALADEVMKEIAIPRASPNRELRLGNINGIQKNKEYERGIGDIPQKDFFKGDSNNQQPYQVGPQRHSNPRENNLTSQQSSNAPRTVSASKRQQQKLKLQEKNANQYQYPFGNANNHRREQFKRQRNIVPENDITSEIYRPPISPLLGKKENLNLQKTQIDQSHKNPFLKDQDFLKQKREHQQRQYRKVLEAQLEEEKKKKEQIKVQLKKDKYQFNDYIPGDINNTANNKHVEQPYQNPTTTKSRGRKHDPNNPPQYQFNSKNTINQTDKHYIKLKIDQIRQKFKKGRIDHEEYQRSINKIQKYYQCSVDAEEDDTRKSNASNLDQIQGLQNMAQHTDAVVVLQKHQSQGQQVPKLPYNQNYINPKQTVPSITRNLAPQQQDSEENCQIYPSGSYQQQYHQQSLSNNKGQNNYNEVKSMVQTTTQMMLNFFKQCMETQRDISMNQHKFMHQTLSRMYPMWLQQQNYVQPQHGGVNTFHTQQLLPSNYQDIPNCRSPMTEGKNRTDHSTNQNQQAYLYRQSRPQTYQPPHFQLNSSSQSHIQKSLQNITSKIPLTIHQLQQHQGLQQNSIANFFNRPHLVKKFKPFQYTEDINQSQRQLSTLSNTISFGQGRMLLNESFQRDLKAFKKMQVQREVKAMRERISGQQNKGKSNVSLSPSQYSSIHETQGKFKDKELSSINSSLDQYGHAGESPLSSEYKQLQNQSQPLRKQTISSPSKKQILQKEERSSISNNPFLKKHVSRQQQYKPPVIQLGKLQRYSKFSTLSNQPLVIDSPRGMSSEILQQQEYQTEPRKSSRNPLSEVESGPCTEQRKISKQPNFRDVILSNNQMLSKYESNSKVKSINNCRDNYTNANNTEGTPRGRSSGTGDSESFGDVDVSPVGLVEYEASSLETIRSEEESVKLSRKPQSNQQLYSKSKLNNQHQQSNEYTYKHLQEPNVPFRDLGEEILTVQSIQQSSGKFVFLYRPKPPMVKKARSASRKKETSLTRSKVVGKQQIQNQDVSASQQFYNNVRSFKSADNCGQNDQTPSYGRSDLRQESKSSLRGPPQIQRCLGESDEQIQKVQFDPNIYESAYQETAGHEFGKKIFQGNQNEQNKLPEIQNQSARINLDLDSQPKVFSQQKQQPAQKASKWKSLQQARNMARECKQKLGFDQHNRSSVEQKLSELESILSSKKDKDESILTGRKEHQGGSNKGEASLPITIEKKRMTNKKDILKILGDLEDDEDRYDEDFHSYQDSSSDRIPY